LRHMPAGGCIGVRGGLVAGLLFVLPGAAVVLAISVLYSLFGRVPLVEAAFFGVKAAVLAIVLEALIKVSKRALKTPLHWMIATAAFIALFAFAIPFPLVIAAAGLAGWLTGSAMQRHRLNRPQQPHRSASPPR
jgi:chromate transporter